MMPVVHRPRLAGGSEVCAGAGWGWAVDADAIRRGVESRVSRAHVVKVRAGMRGSSQHSNV